MTAGLSRIIVDAPRERRRDGMTDRMALGQLMAYLQTNRDHEVAYLPLVDVHIACDAAVSSGSEEEHAVRGSEICQRVLDTYLEMGYPVTIRRAYAVEGLIAAVDVLLREDAAAPS